MAEVTELRRWRGRHQPRSPQDRHLITQEKQAEERKEAGDKKKKKKKKRKLDQS